MPYKHVEKLIPEKYDKRVKLTKSQKEEIYNLYNLYGAYSLNELASMFGVSKRTIHFIVSPEKREENYSLRVQNGGSKQYYDKEKHTIAMQTHRRHKQSLYLNGNLDDRD